MPLNWNVFRILADASHAASKCILIWAIHSNQSAEGVSLITQMLYLVVFCARYLPSHWIVAHQPQWHNVWNIVLKIFYILSSGYIIGLMMRVYPRTRERDMSKKIGMWSTGIALVLSPFLMMIFLKKRGWSFYAFSDIFSLELESVCIIPQLLLLRETTVPTVLDSFYLVTLGSYRAFYLVNWLVEGLVDHHWPPVSIIFGLIQTALYVDFAWVYLFRQRVKLRGGTVVDSDDISKGWLLRRFLRRGAQEDEESPVPSATGRTKPSNKWGARGISVSADEGLREEDRGEGARRLADPDEFEDEPSDDETAAAQPLTNHAQPLREGEPHDDEASSAIGNGSEWQDDGVSK